LLIVTDGTLATWGIAGLATAGVITRPFRWPEAIWAVAGAFAVVAFGLLPWTDAVAGLSKGLDVYLFLAGMMLLAEVARREGLFDWLAALATSHANGSARRLFLLTYMVGAIVTIFLSNDATAVVLTPAVAAVVKAARAEQPVPYLLVCAFIANAASFVLPISNPANLVIYGDHMPPLLQWLPRYLLPSVVSIAATYLALRWTQRHLLTQTLAVDAAVPPLSSGGKTAAAGIAATAAVLLAASAMDIHLGLPTCLAGIATAVVVLVPRPAQTWSILKDISWGVLPLVAGLFVLVEALNQTGVIGMISALLGQAASISAAGAAWAAGVAVAIASNLANNLPVGLIAGSVVQSEHTADHVVRAILIGVDLGPNLSVTGSLATILWLTALRREDLTVGFGTFLKIGAVVMPPALILSIATALLTR
jgi:arsenical pump membrane protein